MNHINMTLKFNLDFFFNFFLQKKFDSIYHKIDVDIFFDICQLLNYLKKNKTVQEKNMNFFVKESRVLKEYNYENLNFLNISEFVSRKQKEIYFEKQKNTFFLKSNLIIQKNYITDLKYLNKLDKNILKYFINIKNLGNFFFVQYRVFGLGFRIKKSSFYNTRSLRFDIGFGHGIYYSLPMAVKCLKRKRRFFIYSDNLFILNFIKIHINNLKLLNPYKIRGLKDLKHEIKMKKGKKQTKK